MIRKCIGIDMNEIRKGIDLYRLGNDGNYPNYLIMNRETLFLIDNEFNFSLGFSKFYGSENYASFWDIPIAVCDKLKTGEVDFT